MTLTPAKKAGIFRKLAEKSIYETGIHFEFDKIYKSNASIRNSVYKIYQEVCQDPAKFSLSQETVDLVVDVVKNRNGVASRVPTVKEQTSEKIDFKDLAIKGRNKALKLAHAKMDRISSSKKKLDAVSVGELAKVYGIFFDKAQIIRGEATEHVAVLSRNIKDGMTPEEALNMVLKMREANNEEKYGDKD